MNSLSRLRIGKRLLYLPEQLSKARKYEAVFDFTGVNMRLMGDSDSIRELSGSLLRDMPMKIDLLKYLIGSQNPALASVQFQKIKWEAAHIGALFLGPIAEIAAQSNNVLS